MEDPNAEAFKETLRNAGLPEFPDLNEVKQTLDAKARQPVQHSWHQEGPALVCDSCPYRHSQWVGSDKRLSGFDSEGRPTLQNITM